MVQNQVLENSFDGATSSLPLAIHSFSWIVWLVAAVVAASTTRNPLYLILILLSLFIIFTELRSQSITMSGSTIVSPIKLAVFVSLVTAFFNMLTVHVGKTIIFRIPSWIPLLGGPITLEAWGYGMINGLVIACLFTAFVIVHMALPTRSLMRYVPRAFYPLAIVASLAITFVPTTLRQFRLIHEAQAVRGHQVHRMRDWVPLFMPLLIGGLERALQLAEAMTAHGFASLQNTSNSTQMRLSTIGGLTLLLCGWLLRLVWGKEILGASIMVAGGGIILATLWRAGRQTPHTVYRVERWSYRDAIVIGGAVLVLLVFLTIMPGVDRSVLYYSPYPLLHAPPFSSVVGVAILGLLLPLQSRSHAR